MRRLLPYLQHTQHTHTHTRISFLATQVQKYEVRAPLTPQQLAEQLEREKAEEAAAESEAAAGAAAAATAGDLRGVDGVDLLHMSDDVAGDGADTRAVSRSDACMCTDGDSDSDSSSSGGGEDSERGTASGVGARLRRGSSGSSSSSEHDSDGDRGSSSSRSAFSVAEDGIEEAGGAVGAPTLDNSIEDDDDDDDGPWPNIFEPSAPLPTPTPKALPSSGPGTSSQTAPGPQPAFILAPIAHSMSQPAGNTSGGKRGPSNSKRSGRAGAVPHAAGGGDGAIGGGGKGPKLRPRWQQEQDEDDLPYGLLFDD